MPALETEFDKPLSRSEEKRAQIVDAASRLFVEAGYGAVSMDSIASEASVSKRTVYSHFEDKSALFFAVMDAHCEAMGGNRVLHDAEGGRVYVPEDIAEGLPDDTTRTVLVAFCVRFMRILVTPQAVRIFRVILSEAERFPDLAESFETNSTQPLIRRLASFLVERSATGEIDIADAEEAAWRLMAVVKEPWHLHMCLGTHPTPSLDEIQTHVESAVDFFLRGYAHPSD